MINTINDITVKQLMDIQKINPNSINGQKEVMRIIYDIDPDNISVEEFLNNIVSMPDIFVNGDKSFKRTVTIDGIEFTAKDIKDFSTKEFIDFDTLAQDNNENMTTLLALIYSNETFDKMDYIQAITVKREMMEKLDAGTALGAIDFFSRALLSYIKNIVVSSPAAKTVMEKNQKMKSQMEVITKYLDSAGN